jgi:predicted DNA-binding transcriptional regulator AlpA
MKLVFTREEVAEALGQSVPDFDRVLPKLKELGFPKPVRGFEDLWPIMDVIRWINDEPSPTFESVAQELNSELHHVPRRPRSGQH